MKHRIIESVQSKDELIKLVMDSIYTSDKATQRDIVLPHGYLEKVCGAISRANVVEKCEWVRSTFIQFSRAAHEGEANHYEPRTVMHFMKEDHSPAFDIVLNFGYRKDSRTYYSKQIMLGMPPSEKLRGHKDLTDLLSDFKVTCVKVAGYWNENEFVKNFASDYHTNIVLNKPADISKYEDQLPRAIQLDAKWAVENYGDYWVQDGEVPEYDWNDLENDTEGNVDALIKDADENGIDLLSYVASQEKILAEFNQSVQSIYSQMYESVKVPSNNLPMCEDDEINREQYNSMVQLLLNQFVKAGWDSIEMSVKEKDELSIIPKFDGEEKNENTVKEFVVKLNGKVVKNLCAQTVERLARQLIDFRNNVTDPPIHITVKLVGVTHNGASGKENVQKNIEECERGQEVRLVRTKNIHTYTDVNSMDETAIEVRTLDRKALGYLPANLKEKDRIARKLVQHKPYTARVYTKLGGNERYKNYGVVISIDFDD